LATSALRPERDPSLVAVAAEDPPLSPCSNVLVSEFDWTIVQRKKKGLKSVAASRQRGKGVRFLPSGSNVV